jgi:hypothetical protein
MTLREQVARALSDVGFGIGMWDDLGPPAKEVCFRIATAILAITEADKARAVAEAVEAERAGIVAWLRDEAKQLRETENSEDLLQAEVVKDCADAIAARSQP